MTAIANRTPAPELPWVVYVDDNFHCMDESHLRLHGRFATLEEAVAACVTITEDSVADCMNEDGTCGYRMFGEDPWVQPRPEREDLDQALAKHPEWPAAAFASGSFSAWTFAELLIANKTN